MHVHRAPPRIRTGTNGAGSKRQAHIVVVVSTSGKF